MPKMIDDLGLTFPRYCEHGKLCDDQCDECDREQEIEARLMALPCTDDSYTLVYGRCTYCGGEHI